MAKKKSKQQLQQYKETVKFNLWVKAFLDPSATTFGNQTQSAILAYKLDPVKQYDSAGVIGFENLKKLKSVNSAVLSKLGTNFKELMQIGLSKMVNGSYDDWEKFMKRMGFFEDDKGNAPGNYTQVNVNLGDAIAGARKERGLPIINAKIK